MALRFEDIENNVFDGVKLNNPDRIDRAACGELKYLLGELQKGRITREEATQAKLKLREKYELCQKHILLMEMLREYILKAQWNFKADKSYIDEMLMGANSISECPDAQRLWLYKDFVYDTVDYFDRNLSCPKPKDYSKMAKDDFMDMVLKRIGCAGYENSGSRYIMLDMKTLWQRLFELKENGDDKKIDEIIEGMRMLCKAVKEADRN